MRIVLTGGQGQLGCALRRALTGYPLVPLDLPAFDLEDPSCGRAILDAAPDVVIHAAAYTNVDGAEREPDRAMAINAEGTGRVAKAAQASGARLLYISTDYVFDGRQQRPYEEADPPAPLNAYGRSKLAGEERALAACERTLVLRTAWLYGREGRNFVKTILALADERPILRVVADQYGCPTSAEDLAQAVRLLLQRDARGRLHVTNDGACSWFEFARKILELSGKTATVEPLTTEQVGRPAPRPAYSVLSLERLRGYGIRMAHWEEALRQYLRAAAPTLASHT